VGLAAPKPAESAPAAAPSPQDTANKVLATVNGEKITVADVEQLANSLPPQLRQQDPSQLLPKLIDALVVRKSLLIAAQKDKLGNDPKVKAEIVRAQQQAADSVLQAAYMTNALKPMVTDAAIQQAYDQFKANFKGEPEVHARHILVKTEAEANDIIKQLKGGADFAALAKKYSTDKGSADTGGGDLGWFKKGDMLPEFSDAAFAMKKGETSSKPVKTQYGYHVIQVLDTRTEPAPTLDQVRDQIRAQLERQDAQQVADKTVSQMKVVRYNLDGSVVQPAPATPPAAPATPAPAGK
ncbi:peptidylprolyl isomerase, partial [Endobacter medicaginis]